MLILTYLKMMWQFSRARSLFFASLLFLSSITEGIGLVLLVPLLGALQQSQAEPTGVVGVIVNGLSFVGIPITLVGLLSAFLALNIFRALINYSQTIVSERFRLELLDDLRTKSFDAMLEARWEWLTTQKKSDMSNLLVNEINRLGSALLFSVRFIISTFSITAYIIVAFSLSLPLTLAAIVLGAGLFFAMRGQHALAHDQGKRLSDANRQVQQTVEEGLSGIKLIKILRSESRQSQSMIRIRSLLRHRMLQFTHLNAAMTFIFQILVALFMVTLLYIGVTSFDLSLPTLLILVLIFSRLSPQIREVQNQINNILHSGAVLANYQDLMRAAGGAREKTLSQNSGDKIQFNKSIKLSGVSFSYKTRGIPSLRDINIEIPIRQTTAIMGTSGSGKSTLADLIMGLLTPDTGTIEIDGILLDETNRLSWRKSVAYMPQDVFLFHDTIRNNLLWADENATDEELERALKFASADFVFDLPEKLETVVGDAGQRLSGGEKQRIALARAMIQKPELIILDEATSALDLENEARIRDTIDKLHDDITVIVIGHRLPTLEHSDQLITLEKGRVKAAGTWADMMKSSG
ncbi:ABC transporter ATP-binding protein [Parasphingorhabdus sp.]|uniref:ABC transporter ATP-binding protein n=1 Tax=Parasphingorhabdus sp. TaxID=2709688 RepID=UPI001B693BAA|nr:ABC transporter ATP-binding protein [Parasphingorhabdus sp.]MBQ0772508.1 ABC transporter ATP-binding protein [Sphingomonadales bacterium]